MVVPTPCTLVKIELEVQMGEITHTHTHAHTHRRSAVPDLRQHRDLSIHAAKKIDLETGGKRVDSLFTLTGPR